MNRFIFICIIIIIVVVVVVVIIIITGIQFLMDERYAELFELTL
jgi:hypothetical protein